MQICSPNLQGNRYAIVQVRIPTQDGVLALPLGQTVTEPAYRLPCIPIQGPDTCYKIWWRKNMVILKDALKISFVGPVRESGSGICRQQNRKSRCIPEVLPDHEEQTATSPVPGQRTTTEGRTANSQLKAILGKKPREATGANFTLKELFQHN